MKNASLLQTTWQTHFFRVCHFVNNHFSSYTRSVILFDWVCSLVSCPSQLLECASLPISWEVIDFISYDFFHPQVGRNILTTPIWPKHSLIGFLRFKPPSFPSEKIVNDFQHNSHHHWCICISFFWVPWQQLPTPIQCGYLSTFPLPHAMTLLRNFSLI